MPGTIIQDPSNGALAEVDSGGLVTIDSPHHQIHEGKSFSCHFSSSVPTAIGEATTIIFKTPTTTPRIHLVMESEANFGATAHIFEGASADVDEGSSLTILNRKRGGGASTIRPNTTAAVAGTASSYTQTQLAGANFVAGTQLYLITLVAGAGPHAVGGSGRDSQEWILAVNTVYAFQIKNLTADDTLGLITLNWYEE